MEYEGKLYGKVGANYFPLQETTQDVDNLKKELEAYKKALIEIRSWDDDSEDDDPGALANRVLKQFKK